MINRSTKYDLHFWFPVEQCSINKSSPCTLYFYHLFKLISNVGHFSIFQNFFSVKFKDALFVKKIGPPRQYKSSSLRIGTGWSKDAVLVESQRAHNVEMTSY